MNALPSLLAVLLLLSSTSPAQTVPTQTQNQTTRTETPQTDTPPNQTAQPAQPASAAAEPAPTPEPAPPTPADAASTPAPAAAFAPGAKLFLEPMDGFDQLLAQSILKKKVPVVLVHDRAQADFVMSGDARVRKPGWFKANFISTHGKGSVSIQDAHTGTPVFTYTFRRVDANTTESQTYQSWADASAKHLKKSLEKK